MGVTTLVINDYLKGDVLPPIFLSFRSAGYAEEQTHFDPLKGLRTYGPYKPTDVKVIHLLPREWIEKGLLSEEMSESIEEEVKRILSSLLEKSGRKVEVKRVEIDNITPLVTDKENVRKEIFSKISDGENVVLSFIPRLSLSKEVSTQLYYRMKVLGIREQKPWFVTQAYSERTLNAIQNEDYFPLYNLALNIFTKAGGIPWVLSSSYRLDYDVVIGVAWSIKRIKESKSTGPSIKYYGVTHIFDERGVWRNFASFACKAKTESLLNSLVESVLKVMETQTQLVSSGKRSAKVLLMLREKPKENAIEDFSKMLNERLSKELGLSLSVDVARIFEGSPIRVYSGKYDHRLPPKGLFFEISSKRAILITTGTLKGEEYAGIGTPKTIGVDVLYTSDNKSNALWRSVRAAFAFTAINWRNLFGSLRLPTPIHYSRIMADLLLRLPEEDVREAFISLEGKTEEVFILEPKKFKERPWFI
ncbi:MAG: hypothetical protein QXO15_08815 [Nitrososphaerota archaeon]